MRPVVNILSHSSVTVLAMVLCCPVELVYRSSLVANEGYNLFDIPGKICLSGSVFVVDICEATDVLGVLAARGLSVS